MISEQLRSIRGVHDILPEQAAIWHKVETEIRAVLARYDYHELRIPILEKTDLFKHSIGMVTDIVEKEMYTFQDHSGDYITLRPEGTAGCARACIEHGLIYNKIQKLWYSGPMFRYEKPQKGRYRQFHQIGAEAYGMPGPDIDAELICLTARLFKQLGILQALTLQINSLGSDTVRSLYQKKLVEYFRNKYLDLDDDNKRRLDTNPMRILDSKNPNMQTLIAEAPVITEYLNHEDNLHFEYFKKLLDANLIKYIVNPYLVRGLDYYCRTVFEWKINEVLSVQDAVCAGGRYDGLIKKIRGQQVPAVGCAIGMERLVECILRYSDIMTNYNPIKPHVYLLATHSVTQSYVLTLAEQIRNNLPELKIRMHCGSGSLKSKFRRANDSGATVALILGDEEITTATVTVKLLRNTDIDQINIPINQICNYLSSLSLST